MKVSTIFMIVYVLGMCTLGYLHEQVHVIIFESYGVESHVEYFSHFPHLITIPDAPCPTEQCLASHHLNEIVSYPLLIIYAVFGMGLVILIAERGI